MEENATYDFIFSKQRLRMSEQDILKIKNAKIAVAGLGGIGAPILELLVRNGFRDVSISDVDAYDNTNFRQLYMTMHTIGQDKVDVAQERVLQINPYMSIQTYHGGINILNYKEFCHDKDIVFNQTDSLITTLILNYACYMNRIYYLHASRASFPARNLCVCQCINYQENATEQYNQSISKVSEDWGVSKDLLDQFHDHLQHGIYSESLEKEIEEENRNYKTEKMRSYLNTSNELKFCSFFHNDISKKSNFYTAAISPEECFLMASLGVSMCKNILLFSKFDSLAINLYESTAIAHYSKVEL